MILFLNILVQGAILAILVFAIGGEYAANDMGRMVFLMLGVGIGSVMANSYLAEPLSLIATAALAIFLVYYLCQVSMKKALFIVAAFSAISLVTNAALTALVSP
ncbi:MAG: hypothetical protein K0U98_05325 [Deltaproteobacteria bacterium]|nr:hypothetical protein [Deltaproteobacteria bacterium]